MRAKLNGPNTRRPARLIGKRDCKLVAGSMSKRELKRCGSTNPEIGFPFLLRRFSIGASIGFIAAAGLINGDRNLFSAIDAASEVGLPLGMLLFAFGGLFGVCYLATALGGSEAPPKSRGSVALAGEPSAVVAIEGGNPLNTRR